MADVDIVTFSAHSVRGVSTSQASNMRVTTADILKVVDWSLESVFQYFYYEPEHSAGYGRAVLSTSSNTVKNIT